MDMVVGKSLAAGAKAAAANLEKQAEKILTALLGSPAKELGKLEGKDIRKAP